MEKKLQQDGRRMRVFSDKLVKETQNIQEEDEEVHEHVHVLYVYCIMHVSKAC